MKNFLIYECLLPSLLCVALMMPLAIVHACVSVNGDTYTVDGYGRAPTSDEMDTGTSNRGAGGGCYRQSVQFEDSRSMQTFKSIPGLNKAQF